MSDGLRDRLAGALPDAMRARDRTAVAAVRSALAAVANAEAVPVATMPRAGAVEASALGAGAAEAARRELSEDDVRRIVTAEVDEREHAADEVERHGRLDDAVRLRAEAAVLVTLLEA